MLLFIPSLPVLCSLPLTSITSVTLDTGTPPSNTAQLTLLPGNYLASRTSKRQPKTRRSALRKMSTGLIQTLSRRTVSAAAAAAILISWMSKASKAAVSTSGLRWPAAGPPHKAFHHSRVRRLPCIVSLYCFSMPFSFSREHHLGFFSVQAEFSVENRMLR